MIVAKVRGTRTDISNATLSPPCFVSQANGRLPGAGDLHLHYDARPSLIPFPGNSLIPAEQQERIVATVG